MYKNNLSYAKCTFMVFAVHLIMLLAVLLRGNCESAADVLPLAAAVLGLDVIYTAVCRLFYKQMTYTTDFMLLLLIGLSVIFQSCFGEIGFAAKHYITCIAALAMCQIGFLLTRNHTWIQSKKKILYIVLGILILSILLFTGSRSMWINIGSFSVQPSEFMKPVFVLLCATSIREQHPKQKILFFYVSKETIALTAAFLIIICLQWWCRDFGSLPTIAAAYRCAMVCRLCYPRAKLSKKGIIGLCIVGVLVVVAALIFAPSYVQDRLSVDIWSQMEGDGYQQCKALIAIAEGGLFGKGPGNGTLYQVFASDTDIVFSTICEEWGFLVALLTILILMFLMLLPMINKPRSYFHTTMILGIVAMMIIQMGLNIFGSCNLIPFTGVTIPFISAGGSSMVTSGFMIGMLKAGQSPVFRKKEQKPKKTKKQAKIQDNFSDTAKTSVRKPNRIQKPRSSKKKGAAA